MSGGPAMAYVSRLRCGCVVAALVDEPKWEDNAERIAEFKRDHDERGYGVEHMPLATAQLLPWGYPCAHMKAAEADAKIAKATP